MSLISGAEKVWIRESGEYQGFLSTIFCLTVSKFSYETLLCCVSEKFR